jgi:hypothetical protein
MTMFGHPSEPGLQHGRKCKMACGDKWQAHWLLLVASLGSFANLDDAELQQFAGEVLLIAGSRPRDAEVRRRLR